MSGDAGADNVAAALAKKAPGGYGLGENPVYIDDANDAVKNGWYSIGNSTLNLPEPSDIWNYCFLKVDCGVRSDHYVVQTVWTGYQVWRGCSVKRIRASGVWQPWEWVNPPLIPGVEYRTTERYNGKPVYVNTVNCGAAVDGTKSVAHGAANVGSIVSATPQDNTVPGCGPYNDGANALFATADSTNITVYAKGSYVGHTVVSVIKYTKTTD